MIRYDSIQIRNVLYTQLFTCNIHRARRILDLSIDKMWDWMSILRFVEKSSQKHKHANQSIFVSSHNKTLCIIRYGASNLSIVLLLCITNMLTSQMEYIPIVKYTHTGCITLFLYMVNIPWAEYFSSFKWEFWFLCTFFYSLLVWIEWNWLFKHTTHARIIWETFLRIFCFVFKHFK